MADAAPNDLSALVAGLSHDAAIQVSVGDKWTFNPETRTLNVSKESLETQGVDYCAGVVAHEVGHYFITRYPLFEGGAMTSTLRNHLLNALEDPRVNLWMQERYIGTVSWFERVYADDVRILSGDKLSRTVPRVIQFGLMCAALDNHRVDDRMRERGVLPEVFDALLETADARRRYVMTRPFSDLVVREPSAIADFYFGSVASSLKKDDMAGADISDRHVLRELNVRSQAYQAFRIAVEEIFPHVMNLYAQDVDDIAALLRRDQSVREAAAQAVKRNDGGAIRGIVVKAIRDKSNGPEGPAEKSDLKLSQAIYEKFYEFSDDAPSDMDGFEEMLLPLLEAFFNQTTAGESGEGERISVRLRGRSSGGRGCRVPKALRGGSGRMPKVDFQKLDDVVNAQVNELAGSLEEILLPRKRLRQRQGFPSGQAVNMRRVFAFEADPRKYNELWIRKTMPDRHRTAVSLLVDLSGSMRGEKAEAAYAGALLFADSLSRLGVPFSVTGFQDMPIPFHEFGESFTAQRRLDLRGLVEEVYGARKGGNNCPEHNDDGPCLQETAEKLLEYPAEDQLLIVISDGQPAGRRSNDDDLKQAVKVLSQDKLTMRLIGLGLGEGTEHVEDYYPNAYGCIKVQSLAAEIGYHIQRFVFRPI